MNGRRTDGAQRGWVHGHSATLVELFRLVDAAWIVGGLWLAQRWLGFPWQKDDLVTALVALALFTMAAGQWPLYRTWRVATLSAELKRNALCWVAAASGLTVLAFLLESQTKLPREVLLLWLVLTMVAMLVARMALRLALRSLRRSGANFRVAAIVGANPVARSLVEQVVGNPWMGIRLLGVFDDRKPDADRVAPQLPIAGTVADVVERACSGKIDIVFVVLPLRAELRIRTLVDLLRDSTVSIKFVPNFSSFGLLSARWEEFRGIPMISLVDTPHYGPDGYSKRVFDVVAASVLLALLALPMAAIALAICATSKGPALFRQKRYGLDGREIVVYKFRTMSVVEDGKTVFSQAKKGDRRVTRLGSVLRRTSLDELPQLINVLQGRMSIVGPRPHPVALNESHRRRIDGYMLRHKVRPGITGWAQVNGCRGETDTEQKMVDRIRYDLEYIDNWSLALDLRIMWRTLFSVIDDPNAY